MTGSPHPACSAGACTIVACYCAGSSPTQTGVCECDTACKCDLCAPSTLTASLSPLERTRTARLGEQAERTIRILSTRPLTQRPSALIRDFLPLSIATPLLRAVYRRGMHEFTHTPLRAHANAQARTRAFVRILRNGRPANPLYTQDDDLSSALTAALSTPESAFAAALSRAHSDTLTVRLPSQKDALSAPESALLALAESTPFGYEMVTPLRAAWQRAVRDGDPNPYSRATNLALRLYYSPDADLLPTARKDTRTRGAAS